MIFYPNAKINIGLNITEKRTDGFHNLESCFFPIKWQDILEIIPTETKSSFSSTGIKIPGKANSNICLKALELLKEDFDIPNVKIHLHKLIPIGAGLGGGSSDGAYTLKGLNTLFELNLSKNQLQNYARKLGSDCAFFIENSPVYAYNKGDEFKNIDSQHIEDYYIYLIYPSTHISTAEAYSNVVPKNSEHNLKELISQPIENWKSSIKNDFEKSIFPNHPELEALKNTFYDKGALYSAMSGSGSTIFGIFKEKPNSFTEMPSIIIPF